MHVEQYGKTDIEISGTTNVSNPFIARIEGRFLGPGDRILRIPGYYAGNGVWKVRFSPTAVGTWNYTIRSVDIHDADGMTGTIECGAGSRKGSVRVSPTNPLHFTYEDGTPHFMNAYECDWLWAYDLGGNDLSRTQSLVDYIKQNSFNTILMNMYAHDSSWTPGSVSEHDFGPPAMYMWEGTNDDPDHLHFNVEFFNHFDAVMDILEQAGIMVHLFIKVYNKKVNWPAPLSPEDDLYFSYITARYQAYWNVTWDFSKESKNEANKDYLYDRILSVKTLDAYRRMVTTHDDPAYFATPKHVKVIDFYTAQQHHHFYNAALVHKNRYGIPYFNSEFGYEHGPGGIQDLTYNVGQSPEELIRRAYEVVMAGGYPAYYYTYTAWDVIDPSYDPPGVGYFRVLYNFFTSIDWQAFEPMIEHAHPNMAICLSRGFEEFLIFPSDDRKREFVFVTADIDITDYEGEWMDILSGEKIPLTADLIHNSQRCRLHVKIPFESGIGLLHLKKK